MQIEDKKILICPKCKTSTLDFSKTIFKKNCYWGGEIVCSQCNSRFPIIEGIPNMLSATFLIDQKAQQKAFHEDEDSNLNYIEFEMRRPYGMGQYFEYIWTHSLNNAAHLYGSLESKNLFNTCCGHGFEAEFFAHKGAKVTALDISSSSVEAARERFYRKGMELNAYVGDSE